MTGDGDDLSGVLADLAADVLAGADPAGDGLDAPLWAALADTGLARLTLPEAAGGSGGTLTDLATVLRAAGEAAARAPLVEDDLLAAWLLHAAGLAVPPGPLTTGPGPRIGWASAAAGVVLLEGDTVALYRPGALDVVPGRNLADEPRDTVTPAGEPEARGAAPAGAARELRLRAALGRALLTAGAARGALTRAVRYAGERVQFGRPIARFQAVQQQLALAAAEVAAAEAAATAAAAAARHGGVTGAALAVAAAKVRTAQAAGTVARISHQVHGAIGFTREHDLRLLTTRLWAWRDEDGGEAAWADELGVAALAAGAEGLWPLVTGAP